MNVVLVVMDTLRHPTSSLESADHLPLDDLGTSFSNTYSTSPWTLPSHASLFTGVYPSRHGAHAGHKRLDDTHPTISEILGEEGYETVAVSNNTWISEEFGFSRGFDTFYKTWQYVQSDTDLGRIARQQEGFDKLKQAAKAVFDGNPVSNVANAVYGKFLRKTHDDGASKTNRWIKEWLSTRNNSSPFFLFVNYLEPHLEYHPPEKYAERYLPSDISYTEAMEVEQDAWGYIAGEVEMSSHDFDVLESLYHAEIRYLSDKINEVVEMLKEAGEWSDTLFIVTSDHGENIGEHQLMDHQYSLYDTLVHVPLVVNGGPFSDGEIDDLVQLTDIPATILDILDIDGSREMQGVSFHPETEESRDYVAAEYLAPQPSMEALQRRVGELPDKVLRYDRSLRAIRTNRYKYIRGSDDSHELYDIQSDPGETDDISKSETETAEGLDRKIDEWLNSFEQTETDGDVSMDSNTKERLEDLGYLQ